MLPIYKNALALFTRHKNATLFLFYTSIVAFCLSPILLSNSQISFSIDLLNHLLGIMSAKEALFSGQFPLRIAYHAITNQFNYPFFQFYSPLSYMIGGFIYAYLSPHNSYVAYKFLLLFSLLLGGIYIHKLAYQFTKSHSAALLAGVMYLTAPYFFVLTMQLYALNECIAFGCLPAVIYYSLECLKQASLKNILLSSLGWSCLAMIHLITFIYSSLTVGMFLFFITFLGNKNWKNLFIVTLSYGASWLLSIWYLAPIMMFSDLFHVNESFNSLRIFSCSHYSLCELLSPLNQIKTMAQTSLTQILRPSIGWLGWLTIFTSIYLIVRKQITRHKNEFFALTTIATLIVFVIWSPFNFWTWIPPSLRVIQYSWRLLGQINWISVLLFACILPWLFNKFHKPNVIMGIAIILLLSTFNMFSPFGKIPVSSEGLQNLPHIIYPAMQKGDYMLTPKDSQLINLIDSIELPLQIDLGRVSLQISPAQLHVNSPLTLSIQGYTAKPIKITALRNDHIVISHKIISQKGNFTANFSIATLQRQKTNLPLIIYFQTSPLAKITFEKAILSGFLNPGKIIRLPDMQKHCIQQGEDTVCKIQVPPMVTLLELPTLYYPQLLKITLNNQIVPYISTHYEKYLITTIAAHPGEMNIINIRFQGLLWANYLSATAWQAWGLLCLFAIVRKKKI